MFSALRYEVEGRLQTIQESILGLSKAEGDSNYPASFSRTLKGLAFVQMYAVYEYCITNAVQCAVRVVNSYSFPFRDLRHELLALTLDANYRSIAAVTSEKSWPGRIELVRRARSTEPASAPETLFPADGSHFRDIQLRTIWAIFGVQCAHVPDNRLIGRIEELVEVRNAIAHGRERAESVGGRFSLTDIKTRHADTVEICRHLINSLEAHVGDAVRLRV